MSDDDLAAGHEAHNKHLQLGYEPGPDDNDPASIDVMDGLEDVWADACTVAEFKRDIELLASEGND